MHPVGHGIECASALSWCGVGYAVPWACVVWWTRRWWPRGPLARCSARLSGIGRCWTASAAMW
eukprot:6326972-Lingulodinium_polyedra.AAC.1